MTTIKNIEWFRNNDGDYWRGELWEDDKRIGLTGTYYDLGEDNKRDSREDQEASLSQEKV